MLASSLFLTQLFVNYYASLVITIPHTEKLRLGLFEWSSRGDNAAFDRHIVNISSVGAPLTDTACARSTTLCVIK